MNVSAGTLARTAVLVLALLNQICAIMGWMPLEIAEEEIYQIVTLMATIGASLWTWWKNNSFTNAAIKADLVMKELKGQ